MADSALSSKLQKHAAKSALTPSKPDAASKSKKASSAKSAHRAKDSEKAATTKSSKSKSKKNDLPAEKADAAGSTSQDAKSGTIATVSSQTLKLKEKKDKRFADLTPEAKQVKRREERQKRKKALESVVVVADTADDAVLAIEKEPSTALTISKPLPVEKPSVRARREKEKLSKAKEWKVSQPIGGRYSTNNLVFSADEKYILLAQGPSLKIFSTKTSLLYRTLQHLRPPPTTFPYVPAGNYSSIANYTLDPANPSQVYTITFSGDLLLWDWTEGTIEGYWKTDLHKGQYLAWCGLHAVPTAPDSPTTTLWTYHEHSLRDYSRKAAREIREFAVPRKPDPSNTTLSSRTILSIDEVRPRHLVIVDVNTFVVDSGECFYVGNRQRSNATTTATTTLQESEWRARKISTPGKILTIDAITRAKKTAGGSGIQGDVAVGDNNGQIFIYHDILSPSAPTTTHNVVKSKLHWHRTGVGALKYSQDGTYLISGGRETVLVIWQLSTNNRQTLPNLGAAIRNIVLSPSGSSYALILADNSILTISTTELKPTASISGIQSRVFLREEYHKIYEKGGKVSKKLKKQAADISSEWWRIPCVKHPWDSMQILLAAPVSQKGESSYPFLQTFDLSQDRGVGKQAITRTLVSLKNVNPEGGKIKEPNVRFLSISGDGMWLASVDEWAAPARDFVDPGAPQPGFADTVAKEVVLRFWRWKSGDGESGQGSWELVSMVESPHGVLENGGAGDVADLTGSPNGTMFASVGSDGTIKIWGKRARTRAGVKVEKEDMVVWNCRRNLELFKSAPGAIQDGRIAYSTDGSVVAVSYTDGEDGVVAIIDPILGTCQQEIGGLQTGKVFAIAFVGRYLVIAGAERVIIWDLVKGQAEWGSELKPLVGAKHRLDSSNFVPNIHLATNEGSGTFAVAVNYPLLSESEKRRRGLDDLTKAGNTASMITVFGVEDFKVLCRKRAVNGVLALEAAANGQGGNGYFWLDGAANVYFLSSGGVVSGGGAAGGESSGYLEDIDNVGGLANAFLEKATIEEVEDVEIDAAAGGDEKVVRSHMLAKLFPAPAYASPAVGDVFGRFMEIVGEKALDVERRVPLGDGRKDIGMISDAAEDEYSDDNDDGFEDAREGEDADISMADSERDVYADLPERGFDVIIDEVGH
ncbi:hypothetical protein H072_6098 [Dactylellina haptotyla CBS 200.50]|uniref:WD40 repeat-like protein n=1 Tax=Dactylellina haptotyla (strain CBS 200.50) TaxID=1284197 RepID=S8AAY8_DACHA|nr:hypothetical protein H072_6098 [Dactylellina haptotyla CBS 200.50]